MWNSRAELDFLGVAQEVDDPGELLLRVSVDSGDVDKRHPAYRLVFVQARFERPNWPRTFCMLPTRRIAKKISPTKEDRRADPDEQALRPRHTAVERLRVHDDLLLLEQLR